MTNTYKIVAVVAAVAIAGAYFFPQSEVLLSGSPVGSTFNTAKQATVSMAPSTSAATSTSILNTDASDRIIQSYVADCTTVGTSKAYLTGAGLASLGWTASFATTSAAAQAASASALAVPLSTSTTEVYNTAGNSTSTTPTAAQRVWATGSYETITFSATNTASCIVGVTYLAS